MVKWGLSGTIIKARELMPSLSNSEVSYLLLNSMVNRRPLTTLRIYHAFCATVNLICAKSFFIWKGFQRKCLVFNSDGCIAVVLFRTIYTNPTSANGYLLRYAW